jgi:enamine deaminase RidA (YjgF/YER057c/UK114 family)
MPKLRVIPVPGLHKPTSYYSHCIRHGDTLYLAGVGGYDAEGTLVGPGDIATQTRQTFTNIRTVLNAAGADLADVIKLTTFIVDPRHHGTVMEIRREFFGEHAPASILCCVNSLPNDGMLIAVETIAAAPD